MENLENNTNNALFLGSFILAIFYQILYYLGIEAAQAITLFIVFCFSGLTGFLRTLALGENLRIYMISDLLAKTLMLFIPFLFALISKEISALNIFKDYAFSFLILGELIAILINIQSIKTRTPIKEFDFYNLLVEKIKQLAMKYLKLEQISKNETEKKEKDERN